jgi:hypothetical protein
MPSVYILRTVYLGFLAAGDGRNGGNVVINPLEF